jgi:hypothetical protein
VRLGGLSQEDSYYKARFNRLRGSFNAYCSLAHAEKEALACGVEPHKRRAVVDFAGASLGT